MVKSKQCAECKKWKPLSAFSKHPTCRYGLRFRCKGCDKKYYYAHKIKWTKQRRKYYQENKEYIKTKSKEYHQTHKVKRSEYQKRYRQTIKGYLHQCFGGMRYRCNNPKNNRYHRYGGRGIKVKFSSSQELVDYVIGVLKIDPRGLTVDRINNDGNYEPGNIRFITAKENCNNKRNSKSPCHFTGHL